MKRLTLILFLISTISAWSQTDSTLLWQKANFDSTANFYNVVQMQNNYFKLHPDTLEGEEGNRSEFYRWAQFWASRVDRSDSQTYSIHSALKKYQAISANISS